MVPWWKRLAFSFLSVILGAGIVGLVISYHDALTNRGPHFDLERLLISTCIVIVASLPGWLLAIPAVILIGNYDGWRRWLWGALGIGIGPLVILGFGIYGYHACPTTTWNFSGVRVFFLLSIAVSVLTTGAYLLLMLSRKPA
jgi:hypothetical protein